MPIANAISQPSASVAQLTACPHSYINAPNRLVIISGQTMQIQGRDVSMRIQQGHALLPDTRRFAHKGSVFELITRATSFCDPHPAFSAAISVQFTVAWASGDSARQPHWPSTG